MLIIQVCISRFLREINTKCVQNVELANVNVVSNVYIIHLHISFGSGIYIYIYTYIYAGPSSRAV